MVGRAHILQLILLDALLLRIADTLKTHANIVTFAQYQAIACTHPKQQPTWSSAVGQAPKTCSNRHKKFGGVRVAAKCQRLQSLGLWLEGFLL